MKFIKNNLFLVILGACMLIVTGVGGYFIYTTSAKADEFEKKVDDIKNKMTAFTKEQHPLTNSTVATAQKNADAAATAYKELLNTLVLKTAVPSSDVDQLGPIDAKNRIEKGCTKMENMLTGNGVAFPSTIRTFTFGAYMSPDKLPRREEIPLLMKNLEIVQELIYLTSTSGIEELTAFSRSESLDPSRRDLFNYVSFNVTVRGDLESIKSLINSVQTGKTYYFFAKVVTLSSDGTISSAGSAQAAGKSKIDRLVRRDAPIVTAGLQLDYIEFHDKE